MAGNWLQRSLVHGSQIPPKKMSKLKLIKSLSSHHRKLWGLRSLTLHQPRPTRTGSHRKANPMRKRSINMQDCQKPLENLSRKQSLSTCRSKSTAVTLKLRGKTPSQPRKRTMEAARTSPWALLRIAQCIVIMGPIATSREEEEAQSSESVPSADVTLKHQSGWEAPVSKKATKQWPSKHRDHIVNHP